MAISYDELIDAGWRERRCEYYCFRVVEDILKKYEKELNTKSNTSKKVLDKLHNKCIMDIRKAIG